MWKNDGLFDSLQKVLYLEKNGNCVRAKQGT